MNILMLCDFYNESLEYQENLLVKYYRKHGHEVTVVTSTFESVFDYYDDRHDATTPSSVSFHRGARIIKLRYRYNVLNRLRAFTRIDRILEEARPDLIYVHDIMLNFPECVDYVRRHPDTRMIMDYHADYSNSGKNALSLKVLHGVFRKRFLDRARPHLSRIFPIVPASATFLHEVYGIPQLDMEVLPLGADLDLIEETRARGAGPRLRAQHGVPEGHLVVVTGGKLTRAKRTHLLLEAIRAQPNLPLTLVVVGDASASDRPYMDQLHQLAAGNPHVHFVGWLRSDKVYEYLDMADLAVFPASQSILWQQAIASGLPLVCGDIGNQDISYLNHHQNLVVLPAAEITAQRLGAELQRLATAPELRRQMREGALRVADEHLNWNRLIERTLRYNRTEGTPT